MRDYSRDFGPFDGKIWLNCASEGPLPHVAVRALQEAIDWKVKPYQLTHKRFAQIPQQLKTAIAKFINVHSDDVILGNSATYGIHLFANGIPLQAGDEVLVMQNDFPVDILPWLGLEEKGVKVRQVKPKDFVLQPEEVLANITHATKVVCLSHVHTFTGYAIDIEEIGKICRDKGIIFIVNFSQSIGTMPIDIKRLPIDGMTTAGFKWLCGPYGTGFCWMTPQLREKIRYNQNFWVNVLSPRELAGEGELLLPKSTSSAKYDVFGTANFFNFCPFAASVEYFSAIGIHEIYQHNNELVDKIISGLDAKKYFLVSPEKGPSRSMLVVFSHRDKSKNEGIFQKLLAEGIYLALWKGNLRVSAHIYTTDSDIARFLQAVNSFEH